ncbi:PREDICTED: uncharacterized protein LOC107183355 [Myotis davidii]|uniref:uncharacterized protein LOC107183355 n=1 Tax=Myotis davidii TaxID=225400 RepID=UPI000767D5B7|nr:PREDICTED: uncharacterized protein LOC107183355 [Myotis davidii]
MPFPGVAKGKQLSSPIRLARVPGALQWWRLQEARGPSPGCTGLPQDLPRSQQLWQLCLPSAGPPPGLQPHLQVLTQPRSNTGPCLFLSASSTAVDEDLGEGGHPLPNFWDSFQVALEATLRGWSGRMGTAQEEGRWPGRLGPAGQASFHPEPGLGSRAAACACPSLSPGWWSHEQAVFLPSDVVYADRCRRGRSRRVGQREACAVCPLHQPHLEQDCATPAPRRDSPDAEKALILAKCCFGTAVNCNFYSAAFDEGKEPPLMAPDRQGWAVKQRTICCLVSSGVCACMSAYTCTVVHSDVCMACACMCAHSCAGYVCV